MRLVTAGVGDRTVACRQEAETLVELAAPDVGALLAHPEWRDIAASDGPHHSPIGVTLEPVVPHPDKIICLGMNYEGHIKEMGRDRPQYPTLFAKFRGALIGPYAAIQLPRVSTQVDWEAELGVVIGRRGREIAERDALDHVAGYCVVNDISARDWQHRTGQFLSGKTFEATTPVGPALVTPDELPLGGAGLEIRCLVDGKLMQSARTDDLCFGVAEIISYVSQIITLLPGDLIATGTPGGVGAGRNPQVFLRPRQTVTTSIEGIGKLVNVCEATGAGAS